MLFRVQGFRVSRVFRVLGFGDFSCLRVQDSGT